MGNVVVTVVKYSALCVYSMSIQPINKLYLFSLTRSYFLKLKTENKNNLCDTSISSPQFRNVLTNVAPHCFV